MPEVNAIVVDTKPIETKLVVLRNRAEAIEVRDAESYALACQIVLDGRKEVKAIGFVLDPGIESAKNHLNELRQQKAGWVDRVTPIIAIAEQKAETFKAEERRKAKIEEDRINAQRRADAERKAAEERREAERLAEIERKERQKQAEIDRMAREKELEAQRKSGEITKREQEKQRKLAEEQAARDRKAAEEDAARRRKEAEEQERISAANVKLATVKPSTPTVAGIKQRVNWKFRVVAVNAIPRSYMMPDEVAIGAMVRRLKDKAQAEAECPGIEVEAEDSI